MKTKPRIKERLGIFALPLYFCVMVCLDLAFRYLYPSDVISWRDLTPLMFTLGWALMMTAVAGILPRKGGRLFMAVSTVFFVLMILVHCVMKNLFGKFFSVQDLLYAGEGAKFFSLKYLQIRLPMLLCGLLAAAGSFVAAWLLPEKKGKRQRLSSGLCGILGLALVLTLHFGNVTDRVEGTMSWDMSLNAGSASSRKVVYTEFTNPNVSMALTGVYHYTFRNIGVTLSPFQSEDEAQALEALDEFYADRTSSLSELQGSLAGKNLIMIMLESIDSFLITPEFMPNLWAAQQQSVYFTNHYTPLYLTAGTFGTEFLSQTGLIPPQNGASTSVYAVNAFPESLANLFREAGYTANSFHAASPAIYNRGAIHLNLGFEAYHSYTELGMEDYMLDSQLLNGFDQMASEEPFFSFIITYSGHGPYDESLSNISDPHLERAQQAVAASGITGSQANMEELVLAVAHAMETDAFIGGLMEALESGGHSEDTVVLFYADHYCKYMTDPEFLMEIKGVDNRNLLCNTPLFFYGTGLPPAEQTQLVSSVDIYPTVCSLFGLDNTPGWYLGQDMFAGGRELVFWPDYSWYDGSVYVDGGAEAADEYQAQTGADVRKMLNMAWDTVIWDYFRQATARAERLG